MEIWKEIPGYEGIYYASNFGRIRSYARNVEKIMHPCPNTKGYLQVMLWKNKKKKLFVYID